MIGARFSEWGEKRLPVLLYPHDRELCDESEEDLKAIKRFVEICKIRGFKMNADNSKGSVLVKKKGSVYEATVDGRPSKHISEFKSLEFVLHESDTHETEFCRKWRMRRGLLV